MKQYRITEMEHSTSMDRERRSLADYVKFCAIKYSEGVAEHIDYVVRFLHDDITLFKDMINHAKSLQGTNSIPSKQYDVEKLVEELTEKEIPVVKDYMFALGAYLSGGTSFKQVDEAANRLLNLIPISASAKHTPTELDVLIENNWD